MRQAVVVIHGVGLDEISPLGPATIVEVRGWNLIASINLFTMALP